LITASLVAIPILLGIALLCLCGVIWKQQKTLKESRRREGWIVAQRDLLAQILLNSKIRNVFKSSLSSGSSEKRVTAIITSAGVIINSPGEEEFALRNMRDEE